MIVTPLDSAQLDSKEQYIFYHKMVEFAFSLPENLKLRGNTTKYFMKEALSKTLRTCGAQSKKAGNKYYELGDR